MAVHSKYLKRGKDGKTIAVGESAFNRFFASLKYNSLTDKKAMTLILTLYLSRR